MPTACKHPQVRVVARQDDVEFVECQTCREVFDAAEFLDMAMEDEEQEDRLDDAKPKGHGKSTRRAR